VLTHMVAKNEIKPGDVLRVSASSDVPDAWAGVLAKVVEQTTTEVENDTLILESACGARFPFAPEETARLEVVDHLAWIGWKQTIADLRAEAEAFRQARDRENEWIQAGEIVRIADEGFVEGVDRCFQLTQRLSEPITPREAADQSLAAWRKRVRWAKARVLVPPKQERHKFVVFVLEDDNPEVDEDAAWTHTRCEVDWYEVVRIRETEGEP